MSPRRAFDPREYWEQRLADDFSLSGTGFKGLGDEFNRWAYRARRRVVLEGLRRFISLPETRSVLEIGPGNGYYTELWRGLGIPSLTGLDITARSVSVMSRRYPEYDFRQVDIGEGGLDLGREYDMITAFDVLHHIVDERRFNAALENIARHASDTSTILIMDFFLDERSRYRFEHQRLRTMDEYDAAMNNSGLRIQSLEPVFTLLNTPFDASRVGNRLLRVGIRGCWWINCNAFLLFERTGLIGRMLSSVYAPLLYVLDHAVTDSMSVGVTTKLAVVKPVTERGATRCG